MKRIKFYQLFILVSIFYNLNAQNHFTPVWEGNPPFNPMSIFVTSANLDGNDLEAGDEIGLFDGNICVGVGILVGPILPGEFLEIVTSTDDPDTPEQDGFIDGNLILYKYWDGSGMVEITDITPTYTVGGPNFESFGTAVMDLEGISINNPPELDPIPNQNMNEEETLDVDVNSIDPDGDNITISFENIPSFASTIDNGDGTGTISFTPGFDDANTYSDIMVIATDDGAAPMALSDTVTFTLIVNNINRPPELDPILDQTLNEGETLVVPISATDPDGDNIFLNEIDLPNFVTLFDSGNGTGTISFTPGFGDSGVYAELAVVASDDGTPSLSDTTSFTLTVSNVNRKPIVDPIANQNMAVGDTLVVSISASDPDGDSVTLNFNNLPIFATPFDNGDGTGSITFIPSIADSGSFSDIQVTATDNGSPNLTSDPEFFTLTVGIEPVFDPSDLTATALVENEVELNWTDNSDNEDGFIIERETPNTEAYMVIDSVGPNVKSYTDASVLDGVRYNYQVKAYNAFTQSDYSNTAQVVTILPAPSDLIAQVFESPWRVELSWVDNSDNELGFVVAKDTGNGFFEYQTLGSNETNFTDFEVFAVNEYSYRLYAFTTDTISDYIDTLGLIVPVELSSFTASLSGNSVNILWSTATELNNRGFEIERFSSSLGSNWEKIIFIEGNGTTSEENHYQYVDDFKNISVKGIIQYRLKQIDFNGTYEYSDVVEVNVDFMPKEYILYQNYPNPFNPSTKIKYALPQSSKVNLTVYNAVGEVVSILVNKVQEEGFHETDFDASNLPSGIYFYRLAANENIQVKKMILLK